MVKTPSAVVSIVPPRKKTTRAELNVLNEYIDRISLWSSHATQADSIRFDRAEVELNTWVATMLRRYFNPAVKTGDLEDLVTRSVAVIAKCRTDLATEVSDPADPHAVYSHQAEMMLGGAVGTIVVRELQQRCNEMLAAGNNDEVKELTRLQHETRNMVQELRNSMDDGEKERVIQLAASFLPAVDTEAQTSMDLPPQPQTSKPVGPVAPRVRAPRKPEAPATVEPVVIQVREPSSQPGRFRRYAFYLVVIAILTGAAAVWFAQRESIVPVDGDVTGSLIATISEMAEVMDVQDRRPYVDLKVREAFWVSSSQSRRMEWISDLSKLAQRHGYLGLVVRSTDGTPLAEWIRDRGIDFPEAGNSAGS